MVLLLLLGVFRIQRQHQCSHVRGNHWRVLAAGLLSAEKRVTTLRYPISQVGDTFLFILDISGLLDLYLLECSIRSRSRRSSRARIINPLNCQLASWVLLKSCGKARIITTRGSCLGQR